MWKEGNSYADLSLHLVIDYFSTILCMTNHSYSLWEYLSFW